MARARLYFGIEPVTAFENRRRVAETRLKQKRGRGFLGYLFFGCLINQVITPLHSRIMTAYIKQLDVERKKLGLRGGYSIAAMERVDRRRKWSRTKQKQRMDNRIRESYLYFLLFKQIVSKGKFEKSVIFIELIYYNDLIRSYLLTIPSYLKKRIIKRKITPKDTVDGRARADKSGSLFFKNSFFKRGGDQLIGSELSKRVYVAAKRYALKYSKSEPDRLEAKMRKVFIDKPDFLEEFETEIAGDNFVNERRENAVFAMLYAELREKIIDEIAMDIEEGNLSKRLQIAEKRVELMDDQIRRAAFSKMNNQPMPKLIVPVAVELPPPVVENKSWFQIYTDLHDDFKAELSEKIIDLYAKKVPAMAFVLKERGIVTRMMSEEIKSVLELTNVPQL